MCQICATLRPDDPLAADNLHLDTAAAALPVYSLAEIANQLVFGYWEYNGGDWRRFDLDETRRLTVDFGQLGETERFIARAALDAWTDVTGITFVEFLTQWEPGDAGGTRATAVEAEINSQFIGTIESDQDIDVLEITLEAGKTYTFAMSGNGFFPMLDPALGLKNSSGKVVAFNDDAHSETFAAELTFTPRNSGTFYLFAGTASTGDQGDYRITLAEGPALDGGADITFDNSDSGAYSNSSLDGNTILSSYINVATNWDGDPISLNSYWFQTYVHEIGHALGLGHAGNYNGSAEYPADAHYANDSVLNSIMSYFPQWENDYYDASAGYLATLMPADILAIQALYGTDFETRAGNTVYGANSNVGGYLGMLFAQALGETTAEQEVFIGNGIVLTLFDTGGRDTLDLSPVSFGQEILLAAGALSSVGGGQHNMAIAAGTVIENAIGGSAADRIVGNAAANRLAGLAGADTLSGGAGADTLGGGAGNDRLIGGAGGDTLTGGAGADWFQFAAGRDVITDFTDDVDTLVLARSLWGGATRSIAAVLEDAAVVAGNVVFSFGSATLTLRGFDDLAELRDDLAFI